MIRGLYTASAGMQVEMIRQESIANNLANVNTAGFRRDLAVMEARKGMSIARTNNATSADPIGPTRKVQIGTLGNGVLVNRIVKDFTQGDLRQTDNPFDLALQGKGFMAVQSPADGKTYYSRDGQFTKDKDGFVVDKSGNKLMGQNGPIVATGQMAVSVDGTVRMNGKAVDRLQLASFPDADADLAKHGDTLFDYTGGAAPEPADKLEVHQGMLEGANVNSVQEMVSMISVMRQYEANSKALQAQDETLGRAVNDIAK